MCRDGAVLFLTYFRLTISVKISLCGAAIEIASVWNPEPMVVIIFTVQHCVVCMLCRAFSPWSCSALWRRRSSVKERRENNVSGLNFGTCGVFSVVRELMEWSMRVDNPCLGFEGFGLARLV